MILAAATSKGLAVRVVLPAGAGVPTAKRSPSSVAAPPKLSAPAATVNGCWLPSELRISVPPVPAASKCSSYWVAFSAVASVSDTPTAELLTPVLS